jgi:hypothetical protein
LRPAADGAYGRQRHLPGEFGLYNTEAEVDALVDALQLCHELFA